MGGAPFAPQPFADKANRNGPFRRLPCTTQLRREQLRPRRERTINTALSARHCHPKGCSPLTERATMGFGLPCQTLRHVHSLCDTRTGSRAAVWRQHATGQNVDWRDLAYPARWAALPRQWSWAGRSVISPAVGPGGQPDRADPTGNSTQRNSLAARRHRCGWRGWAGISDDGISTDRSRARIAAA